MPQKIKLLYLLEKNNLVTVGYRSRYPKHLLKYYGLINGLARIFPMNDVEIIKKIIKKKMKRGKRISQDTFEISEITTNAILKYCRLRSRKCL